MCFVPRIWHSTLLITSKWVHSRKPPAEAAHLLGLLQSQLLERTPPLQAIISCQRQHSATGGVLSSS